MDFSQALKEKWYTQGFNACNIFISQGPRSAIIDCHKTIVTDEGGITSHAAIISRELEIPCIIGTKVATKIFKNGMMVEVKANHGLVKIIKK